MKKLILCPYLIFDGQTKEAMQFYHSVLGGDLVIQTFEEAFPDSADDLKDRIIHAQLQTDDLTIMASDTNPEYSSPHVAGNNVNLSLVGEDSEKLTNYFNKFSEGGKIEMPLEKQFWGDTFGSTVDKFGIYWMVNISAT